MADTDASDGSPDLQHQLLAIRQDPQVIRLALKWAGDPELAEDVLHTAYCAAAGVKHPERIEDLRAYFLKLKHEVYHLYSLRQPMPLEDPEAHHPSQPGTLLCAPARPIDETVCTSLQIHSWLERLADERDCLLAAIPARSDDPARYRAVIYDAAEQVLRSRTERRTQRRRRNDAFRAAYPEYFDSARRRAEHAAPALPPGPRRREGRSAGHRRSRRPDLSPT